MILSTGYISVNRAQNFLESDKNVENMISVSLLHLSKELFQGKTQFFRSSRTKKKF